MKVGFIGYGYVLEEARKICDELGYPNEHYSSFEYLDCDVLFALRLKVIIPLKGLNGIPAVVIHYGKLPYYKGWYPINQAVKHGEKEVGITMFYIDEGIDTGDIIEQRTIEIEKGEAVDPIYQRCNAVALEMFRDNIKAVVDGTAKRIKQPQGGSCFSKEQKPSML